MNRSIEESIYIFLFARGGDSEMQSWLLNNQQQRQRLNLRINGKECTWHDHLILCSAIQDNMNINQKLKQEGFIPSGKGTKAENGRSRQATRTPTARYYNLKCSFDFKWVYTSIAKDLKYR